MAKGKKPTTRKGAAGKAAGKAKPRKPSTKKSGAKPGPGHNKPPPDPPPITSWSTPVDNSAQFAQAAALRQRAFRASTATSTTGTPLASDPAFLRRAMLSHIAALEETIRKLPTPLSKEVEEAKRELDKLKAQPLPAVKQAPSRLRKLGELIVKEAARQVVSQAVKGALDTCGHQLIELAQWIADNLI